MSVINSFGEHSLLCVCVFESLSSWEDSYGKIEDMKYSGRKYLVAIQSVRRLYCLGKVLCRVEATECHWDHLNLVERLAWWRNPLFVIMITSLCRNRCIFPRYALLLILLFKLLLPAISMLHFSSDSLKSLLVFRFISIWLMKKPRISHATTVL